MNLEESVTEPNHGHPYKETVQLGDEEITIEYSTVELDDVDWGRMALVISGANYHAQLDAVRKFLSSQKEVESQLKEDLRRAEQRVKAASGDLYDLLNEDLIGRWESSVYEDATRSIAAAVMLAPLVESLLQRLALVTHGEWSGQNVPSKIMGLMKDCELSPIPGEFERTLRALFKYRNNMLHWGLEWPLDDRRKFPELIRDSGWSESWFNCSDDGEGPWIFYLTDEFVSHCLDTFDLILDLVQEYIQAKGLDQWQ